MAGKSEESKGFSMGPRFLLLIFMLCGLAVTADARPRTQPERVVSLSDIENGTITLEEGKAQLAGIVVLQPKIAHNLMEKLGKEVEVKALGADRYGRVRVLLFAREAPLPVQVELLRAGAAMAYDEAATPAAWKKAEAEARAARRGLWATPAISSQKVDDTPGRFQRVAGKVTRTIKARDA